MAASGQSIGHYRVGARLGAGGMGEVWQATDTRLNREVAIKVLPAAFASDPVRMERFRREAQVLAALNHPGIATVFGVEQNAFVMELVEGPTLADHIQRGKLALDEALSIASQIADALEYAHERGIVHRDLKPANIKRTSDGRVKLLDFGLAKAVAADATAALSAEAVTLTTPATLAGTILGTAAYMAPEQARGKTVDRRADIWAFGVVLYEMLTGRRPFAGEDVTDTLAAVVKLPPDLSPLPDAVRPVVARCLEKFPGDRWGWIGEVRHALQHPPAPAAPAAPALPRRTWLTAAAVVAALLAGAALAWWLLPQPPPSASVVRFQIPLPPGEAFSRTNRHVLAISPDGTAIVYTVANQLYLRPLNALAAYRIPGAAADLYEPVFSPDGKWIAYFTPNSPLTLQKIPVSGGTPVTLCTLPGNYSDHGVSWRDGRIVFGYYYRRHGSIQEVSDAGGAPRTVATVPGAKVATQPLLFDHGRRLLFAISADGFTGGDADQVVIQTIGADASRRVLLNGGTNPHLLPDGRLSYFHNGTIFAIRFNQQSGTVSGTPVPLVTGVSMAGDMNGGQFALSAQGTLVYWPGSGTEGDALHLVWVDPQGRQSLLGTPPRNFRYPRVSPDGKLVAVSVQGPDAGLWLWNSLHSTFSRLVIGPGTVADFDSAWSRDSRTLFYTYPAPAGGLHLYRVTADGATAPVDLGSAPGPLETITPDASYGIFGGNGIAQFGRSLSPGASAQLLLSDSAFPVDDATLSPDGHWLAYLSLQTGRPEVYVRPWPNLQAGRWQVSDDQGVWPVWSPDGRALFFHSNQTEQLMAAPVQLQPTFSAAPSHPLFPWRFEGNVGRAAYTVAPDGRFLVVSSGAAASGPAPAEALVVVTHWDQEVAARLH